MEKQAVHSSTLATPYPHSQLKTGNAPHQLRRAVSHANFGKLRFKTEHEQKIWGECSRLITNCIIYYNAAILSKLLAYQEKMGNHEGVAQLKQVSPAAWQNVNLQGRFQFNNQPEPIDMEAIIQKLSQVALQQHFAE